MDSIVQWLVMQLRSIGRAAPRPANGDYIAFDHVDGHTLDHREFRRSASLCSNPSMMTDFGETEAGCTYTWAPLDLSAKS